MGFKLRREVRDLIWAGALTASERLLLLELADNANDETREAFPGMDWIVAKCDLPSKKRVGGYLASIAAKWFEIRVEIGKDKNGNPLYAMPKIRTKYRFPTRLELVARHGTEKVPENQGLDACKAPENPGPKVPGNRGTEASKAPENQGPFSSGTSSPQKISSSLSPREDDRPRPPDAELGPNREREVDASPEEAEPTNPIHRLLLDAGCPTENLIEVEGELLARHEPRSPAWWRTVAKNGDLPDLVAEVLEALQPIQPELTVEHHANAHPYQPNDNGSPNCKQCELPKANGRHRVGNQGGGYIAQRMAAGADANAPPLRRSTSAMRAEQALTVADELDRKNGHGKYASSTYIRMTDSHHPSRDYSESY